MNDYNDRESQQRRSTWVPEGSRPTSAAPPGPGLGPLEMCGLQESWLLVTGESFIAH